MLTPHRILGQVCVASTLGGLHMRRLKMIAGVLGLQSVQAIWAMPLGILHQELLVSLRVLCLILESPYPHSPGMQIACIAQVPRKSARTYPQKEHRYTLFEHYKTSADSAEPVGVHSPLMLNEIATRGAFDATPKRTLRHRHETTMRRSTSSHCGSNQFASRMSLTFECCRTSA